MRLGAHCSTAGGFHMALKRAKQIGAESCQIFVKNNMRWFGKPPDREQVLLYSRALLENPLSCVFAHTGYLINLSATSTANRENSIKSLIQEIEFAEQLNLPFIVMHPGAHLGSGETAAIKQIAAGLNEVFAATRKARVRIALENTAGQGTCLGNRPEHFAGIYEKVRSPKRLGLCLDTAHFFAAGFDIRSRKGWDAAIGEIEKCVGSEQILAFHLNDSKTELGSRVDRHAHIGAGKIGKEAFRHIMNDQRFKNHPGCLETEKSEDLHEDIANLQTLRTLITKKGIK